MIDALDIRVRGIVQGVGFRPFVYRLAKRYLVSGWVLNDREGVFIHAEAEGQLLNEFVMELADNAPASARVTEVELKEVPFQDCTTFEIRTSDEAPTEDTTLVSADLATCDDCLRELFDPADRRYRYPFINCTNCGPRFTIIDALPYDRPVTSMASFAMCPSCAAEYADPADRRFHAQPDACWQCGPHVSWRTNGEIAWGTDRASSDAIFSAAVDVLAAGGILAVKGLGGFHLVCDAENPDALHALRERKQRDGKAFAVMVPDAQAARRVCLVDDAEAAALSLPARPIVLLRKRADTHFAAGLADGLPELGVMLPTTPVQHLLLHDWRERTGRDMLVMTSGNRHDEPIVIDDADAYTRLGGIADAFLGNDRPIRARYDDSVLRILHVPGATGADARGTDVTQMIRRARGYAPVPITLQRGENALSTSTPMPSTPAPMPSTPAPMPSTPAPTSVPSCVDGVVDAGQPATVFAAGSEQKSTFTYAIGDQAFVSQHIGDVEDADVLDAWHDAKHIYERLFNAHPDVLACDLHPEYLTAKWAREYAAANGLPLVEVQHHHAHIASVLGEHGLAGPVCGIAFDGTGYGPDAAIWGGEVLLANQADYERFANFAYFPLPGGAAAIKNPLRCAYGALWAFDLLDHPGAQAPLQELGDDQANLCAHMVETGLNAPMTSSVGRLFDAASALLGICPHPTYEGEAAILLDAAAEAEAAALSDAAAEGEAIDAASVAADIFADAYTVEITKNAATSQSTAHDTSVVLLDAAPVFRALLDDLQAGVPVGRIALRFHGAIVGAIVQAAELVRAFYGIDLVALSGGVFMNRLVAEQSLARLGAAGFTVALNADLPPNDGCISYGQAVAVSTIK